MPLRAILLRLLLCVALVFNGAGAAMASVQMMQMHVDGQAIASVPAKSMAEAEVAMPCHHHGQASHENGVHAPSKGGHPAPDCCKSNTCTCACANQVAIVVPVIVFHGAMAPHAGNVRPMALGHPAPALPHLIRPPIG
jgi:hypothetical protein